VKNPMYPNRFGGVIGQGKYSSGIGYTKDKGSNYSLYYKLWICMLQRCNSDKEIFKTYNNVKICDEWMNFQNFAEWVENNNWIPVESKLTITIDKDIYSDSDIRIYSPSTCCIIPKGLNSKISRIDYGSYKGIKYSKKFNYFYYSYCSQNGNISIKNENIDDLKDMIKKYKIDEFINYLDSLKNNYNMPLKLYNDIINKYCKKGVSYN